MEPTQQQPKPQSLSEWLQQERGVANTSEMVEEGAAVEEGAVVEEGAARPANLSEWLDKRGSSQPVRRGPGGVPLPSQLSLPMATKEPPKPPLAMQGAVPASKKNIKVPAYVRRYMESDDRGEPILYLTQAPNQGSGINVSRHKAKIKARFFQEEKERLKKMGREWSDLSDELKGALRKTAGRKADKLINSWIDDQRGTTTLWVKGDPAYEKDELIKKSENNLAWRAWAPFEALIFPQTTEVITKTDVGKTFQQLNDFEGALGWLSYLGRFAPSTLLYTTIAGGGWGTPEHIKELKAGKDAFSYTTDLGDWMTDQVERTGIISKETSDNWWVNLVAGGAVTLPLILMEPDIATPVGMAVGALTGGPTGAAGGFLASKGAKGLKAFKPARQLNKTIGQAQKAKDALLDAANVVEGSEKGAQVLLQEAQRVINGSRKTTMGRVLREGVASRLSMGDVHAKLAENLVTTVDAIQAARKAAPDVIDEIEFFLKQEKLGEMGEEGLKKLEDIMKGNEKEVLEYFQAKTLANKILADELAVNERFARGLSQFKPKQQTPADYSKMTSTLGKTYDALTDLEKQIRKSGATEELLKKRSKLLDEIQNGHKTWGKANVEQALHIAAQKANMARKLFDESEGQLSAIAKGVDRVADPDLIKQIADLRKGYTDNLNYLGETKTLKARDARILYDTTLSVLDDMIESANSLKKNIGVKTKTYGVPEVREGLSALYGTSKMDEVVEVFDKAFGRGVFREKFVEKFGSPELQAAVAGKALTKIDSSIYDELQSAITNLVEEGIKKQKSDLGIELGEQMIQTSDFITALTEISGINRTDRWMGRAAEMAKNFIDPARKKFGSPIKAVVKSGRAMDSLIKRSYSETGEVFTSKIPRDEIFKNTLDDVKDKFATQAKEYLENELAEGSEYVEEAIRVLWRGKGDLGLSNLSVRQELIRNFLKAPSEKVLETITENSMRKARLRKLMDSTEPIRISRGMDTLTNIGKSSWWELSKSWWRRSGALKPSALKLVDETLEGFVRSFMSTAGTTKELQKAAGVAANKLKEHLLEHPDSSLADASEIIRKALGGMGGFANSDSARDLALRAASLATTSSQERALFDLLRRVGGVTQDVADDIAHMLEGEAHKIKDFREVFNVMERYGLPISRDIWKNAKGSIGAALEPMKVGGQYALIPHKMIKAGNENLAKLTKELAEYNPTDQLSGMLANNVAGIARLWRSSIITGLVFPNPTHYVNILFGNFSQIWAEVGFKTATRVTAQTLKDFVPYFGAKLDEMLVESQLKTGNNTTLASVFNAVLNPQVGAFFNRALAKDSDKILGAGSKYAKTWGELREIAAREGVLSTYIGTDIRKAITRRMLNRGKGGKLVDKYVKGEAYQQFAEAVEQRQRVALFMDLVVRKGMNPKEAADNVKKALYDWDAPLGEIEGTWLNNIFLFWRFWKQSLGQAARHLTDPLKKPPETPTDLIKYSMFQKSPLGRGIDQARIVQAIPELAFDKQTHEIEKKIEAGTATPEEVYLHTQSMLYPWWKKEGNKAFLANYPIDSQSSDQYAKLYGKHPTHEAVTMPGLTVMDTYGMILGLLGGLSAATVTGGRALAGSEDVDAVDTKDAFLEAVENPLRDLANPAAEAMILDSIFGREFDYDEKYTKLKPIEKKLLRTLGGEGWLTRRTQGKNPDPEGVERLNSTVVNLFRMTPFLGTQMSRTFDPALEAWEKDAYVGGLMHVLRQLSGLGKTYPGIPESQIVSALYKIKDEAGEERQEARYEYIEEDE